MGAKNMVVAGDYLGKPVTSIGGVTQIYICLLYTSRTISKKFDVSRQKAGRLVMTESAYFSSAAQNDCYGELDVEEYKIVESLDTHTCELCGSMDGKVFKRSEYAVGLTAPPFHPWCRGCTCPHFADMDGIGERYARDAVTGAVSYTHLDVYKRQS